MWNILYIFVVGQKETAWCGSEREREVIWERDRDSSRVTDYFSSLSSLAAINLAAFLPPSFRSCCLILLFAKTAAISFRQMVFSLSHPFSVHAFCWPLSLTHNNHVLVTGNRLKRRRLAGHFAAISASWLKANWAQDNNHVRRVLQLQEKRKGNRVKKRWNKSESSRMGTCFLQIFRYV